MSDIGTLNSFTAGTVIESAPVNENFADTKTSVNTKQDRDYTATTNDIAIFDGSKQTVTSSKQFNDSGDTSSDIWSAEKVIAASQKFPTLCINSGAVDSDGDADILSYVANTVSFDAPITLTGSDGNKKSVISITDAVIPSTVDGCTYNLFVGDDGTTESFTQAIQGKDLYVDFSQGNANDNYGLNTVTVVGSPTYTGNKFNSNGTTGLKYDIPTLGSGKWCVQRKFLSTNTTTSQILNQSENNYKQALVKDVTNTLFLYLSSNGTSWDIASAVAGTKNDWDIATEYYLRTRFTGTQYLVDWSIDGISWTNDITVTSSTAIYPVGSLYFGIDYDESTFPLIGTMDDIKVTVGNDEAVIKNNYTVSKSQPLYAQENDIWLDTSVEAIEQYQYDGADWTNTYDKVRAGQATTDASGSVDAVINPKYNQNWYNINMNTSDLSGNISNEIMGLLVPDMSKFYSLPQSTNVTIDKAGWVIIQGRTSSSGYYLSVNGVIICQTLGVPGVLEAQMNGQIMVGVGDVVFGVTNAGELFGFAPCKGNE